MTAESTEAPGLETGHTAVEEKRREMITLEICFLGFIAVITLIAFVKAMGYAIVSSRTPFVIMVPLFILTVVQAYRLAKRRHEVALGSQIRNALSGGHPHFRKVVAMCGWMAGLLALIVAFGHFVGLMVFSLALMWFVAREKLWVSLLVAAVTTLGLFLLFELAFDVELYRGLLFRYFAGYRDF